MSRRTILCEKLTGDTRSLIWTDSRGPGYRHDTRDTGTTPWTRKRTLFASMQYLPPSSLLQLSIKASLVDKAGRPSRASMRPWPRPLALAQEVSWARTTPPLFDFSVYRARARGREGINRGQSSNTWKQQQLHYIFF